MRRRRSATTAFCIISILLVMPPSSSAFLAPLASSRKSRATAGRSAAVGSQSRHDRTISMTLEAEDKETSPDRVVSLAELERLEREFYYNQKEAKRLGELKKQLEDMPKQRQCHRYRWTQTETKFDVEIPMLKACEDKDLYLVVDKDQMQVAIKTDDSFGAIIGVFPGDVDEKKCSYRIHSRNNEPYIHIEVVKMPSPGVYEFWRELLQGEVESPTIRFAGTTERYTWKQNAETVEVTIPVPDEVRKRKTKLDLNKAGERMHLSFTNKPEINPLEGKFKGLISPLDSVWMLDEGENGKMLTLTIKKRRGPKDTTVWWSGVLEDDDKW